MLELFKSFMMDEEGGADQLIVSALLVLAGIAIAIFFGDQIKDFVKKITDSINSDQTVTDIEDLSK